MRPTVRIPSRNTGQGCRFPPPRHTNRRSQLSFQASPTPNQYAGYPPPHAGNPDRATNSACRIRQSSAWRKSSSKNLTLSPYRTPRAPNRNSFGGNAAHSKQYPSPISSSSCPEATRHFLHPPNAIIPATKNITIFISHPPLLLTSQLNILFKNSSLNHLSSTFHNPNFILRQLPHRQTKNDVQQKRHFFQKHPAFPKNIILIITPPNAKIARPTQNTK